MASIRAQQNEERLKDVEVLENLSNYLKERTSTLNWDGLHMDSKCPARESLKDLYDNRDIKSKCAGTIWKAHVEDSVGNHGNDQMPAENDSTCAPSECDSSEWNVIEMAGSQELARKDSDVVSNAYRVPPLSIPPLITITALREDGSARWFPSNLCERQVGPMVPSKLLGRTSQPPLAPSFPPVPLPSSLSAGTANRSYCSRVPVARPFPPVPPPCLTSAILAGAEFEVRPREGHASEMPAEAVRALAAAEATIERILKITAPFAEAKENGMAKEVQENTKQSLHEQGLSPEKVGSKKARRSRSKNKMQKHQCEKAFIQTSSPGWLRVMLYRLSDSAVKICCPSPPQ
eukprot:gnl/MRDRNA2_/MRDRNA2_111277_c0_seq1.p1 gnl/MRDRNA2_/MRDRNA2_111277_c0~~gnl/MRDRNA2_/MRDRNA2_111277_c0_seq1.p1  ORF type:complete len:347 (-),score=64.86 gnl/MRDRNA2_/MRDRNA2_111277_c0_seq1:357-1397(-)